MTSQPNNDDIDWRPSYDFLMSDELRSLVAYKDGKPVATTSKPGPDCTIEFTGMTITRPRPEARQD